MKTPAFWYGSGGSSLGWLLSPLGFVYGAATAARLRAGRPVDAGVPIICVGNLTAGGAGKTPVVLDLAKRFATANRTPHVISKGYGARDRHSGAIAPLRVDPDVHSSTQVGDEPLMMAASVPVWVGVDRPAAAAAARAAGAGILILDDGFQDPSLMKTVSLVVVDGRHGFGNGHMIPAGPLRETVAAGLARADAIVIMGDDHWGVATAIRRHRGDDLKIMGCRVVPGTELARLSGMPVFAFSGIGHPDNFFRTLDDGGCRLAGHQAFADHHVYGSDEIDALKRRAAAMGAALVTTEKDRARLSPAQAEGIEVLTITLEWDDEAALDHVLQAV